MHDDKRNRPSSDAPIMRAGYAVTEAAYRPQAWRGRNRGGGIVPSFTGRHTARGFAVAIVDDDRGHAGGSDAIDQAIGFLVLVTGPVAGDVDAITVNFERQMRNGGSRSSSRAMSAWVSSVTCRRSSPVMMSCQVRVRSSRLMATTIRCRTWRRGSHRSTSTTRRASRASSHDPWDRRRWRGSSARWPDRCGGRACRWWC